MSWDIYGNPLQRGHCEVHPYVHEEYPCSLCMNESYQYEERKKIEREMQAQCERDYEKYHNEQLFIELNSELIPIGIA